MSLKEYSREELEVTSMLELANDILREEQKAQNFNDLYNKVAEMKGFTEEQKQEFIAQFYTDLTVDGRFLTIESGLWGLKRWYPVEQMEEFVTVPSPKKKKKKKKETKKEKKEEEIPREESEERDLDNADDRVEILTDTFDDEVLDEDELDETGFDDEFDEDDDFDDDVDEVDEDEENK